MTGLVLRVSLPLLLLGILFTEYSVAQLVPEWIVSGRGQFTNPKTITGIAACEGGYYITGGMIDNDFVLQVSDDAGRSWNSALTLHRYGFNGVQPPLDRPFAELFLTAVARPEPHACFAYGWGSYEIEGIRHPLLLRSLDSGRTWKEVKLADSAQGISEGCFAMKDALHGIRNGGYIDEQNSVLYRTTDGGDSWHTVAIPFVDYRAAWLSYAKDGALFATEWRTQRRLYRSTDGGDSFEFRGELRHPRKPSFISADCGWLAFGVSTGLGDAERDVILRTTDGGLSWHTQRDTLQEPPFGLTAIAAADERHVIAVGRIGKLLHSSDAGLSWETAARPFYLYDPATAEVVCSDSNSAVAGALHHIATYTGKRTLRPPVVTCTEGSTTLHRTAQWTNVDGAAEYQLELAEDDHSNSIQYEIFDTDPYEQSDWISATFLRLDPWLRLNRDYFVRVRARGGGYTSDWSEPIKFYTSPATLVEQPSASASLAFSLSPQPASGSCEVRVNGLPPDIPWTLRVHDLLGLLLVEQEGRSSAAGGVLHRLPLYNVPSGLVIVHFRYGDQQQVLPLRVLR